MTETEKIKKLVELNSFASTIIVDADAYVHEVNEFAIKKLQSVKVGKSLFDIFDKNTALLVKNNLIDVKAYKKIQRRKVSVLIADTSEKLNLIISPFVINDNHYYYVVLFDENTEDNLITYPTIDENNIKSKYWQILKQLEGSFPKTLIEKKNFQFDLDIEKSPIVVKQKENYLFANDSFLKFTLLSKDEILLSNSKQIFELSFAEQLNLAEQVLYITQNMIVIESTEYSIDDIQQKNRIVCTPIFDDNKNVFATICFGGINPKRSEEKIIEAIDSSNNKVEEKDKVIKETSSSEFDDKSNEAKIVYNKNNFKILEANEIAAKLYGYSLDELLKMDVIDLCSPEDMQKLLSPISDKKNSLNFNHIKSDGSNILVEVIQEKKKWNNVEAIVNFISLKEKEITKTEVKKEIEKVTKKNVAKESHKPIIKEEVIKKEIVKKKNINDKNENTTPFLSSLFHELLTPVNVILGFVQEIIDSIEKPTEEQEESAQIIKDNQQLLLQTMNTAVQFAQVNEGNIKQNIEEFNINNYLIDIKDSIAKISEKENVEVNFENISEQIILKNDRKKLSASISYYLKFIIKLTNSKKISVSFQTDNNQFLVVVNDEDGGVSEKLASEIIEIYRTDNNLEKNNFKISPITIKLARKLNEITFGDIKKNFVEDNSVIVLTFPIEVEKYETHVSEVQVKKNIVLSEQKNAEEIDAVEISGTEVEEKIIEDIAEEKEIETKEITTIDNALPKEHSTEQTVKKSVKEKVKLSKLSCLLIEDSIDSQLLFKTQMRDFKLLKIASGLTDALPLITKYSFDIIYVDINLQGQYNGLDALKIIRQFENYKTTPIIAVTSYPFEGDKENFILAGFNDYFVKPLLRKQLLNSIDNLF